ncbi:MAG TPA: VOC family protein [Candidatus Acidoferrales bacterium]|nr:VOC family protein [Candidatus Acidoferrales bacterium]
MFKLVCSRLAGLPVVVVTAAILWIGVTHAGREPQAPPTRPPIIGISHIGLRTADLAAARKFYTGVLGLAECFSLDDPPGKLLLTYFKVNDHQYVEIFPELKDPKEDRLSHIAFETTDAEQLRAYMASRGVHVPEKLDPMLDGNRGFEFIDPDGHTVEFVQYMPGSLHSRNFGKFLPTTRISDHMIHVGVVVHDRAAADHFYHDILGFQETWQGGMTDSETDWVDMRVPDGTDWLEYMLNVKDPSPRLLGIVHHFALGVSDVQAAYKAAVSRGYKADKPQIGRDGKWQLNLYDPDLTRAELMEPKPVRPPCCSPMKQ